MADLNQDDLLIFKVRKKRESGSVNASPQPQSQGNPNSNINAGTNPNINFSKSTVQNKSASSNPVTNDNNKIPTNKPVQRPEINPVSKPESRPGSQPKFEQPKAYGSTYGAVQPETQTRPNTQSYESYQNQPQAGNYPTYQQPNAPQAPAFVASQMSDQQFNQALGSVMMDQSYMANEKHKETKAQLESRRMAANLMCVWHPWRPAYAICNYCHRPFCYEDLVSHNGNYYCLEDIDKVSTGYGQAGSKIFDSNSSEYLMLGSVLMILPIIIIAILASSQVSYLLEFIKTYGISALKLSANFSYLLLSVSLIFVLLQFFGGLFSFIDPKTGPKFGIFANILVIALFVYLSATYLQLYEILIAIFSFFSLMLVAYSIMVREPTGKSAANYHSNTDESIESTFANVGKF
ncbi:hypothetical protein [Candidatus Mancarchaeum acidiphilum]|nr:hypothetical protein [Candidatus Mancarchaeum acidiphilum]